jgi:hypothetical protein
MGDPVVAPRRVIALPIDAEQRQVLLEISRSRTEPQARQSELERKNRQSALIEPLVREIARRYSKKPTRTNGKAIRNPKPFRNHALGLLSNWVRHM